MARAMWKGAIQFGLVTIPVKLYLATESDYTIRFNMLPQSAPVSNAIASRVAGSQTRYAFTVMS